MEEKNVLRGTISNGDVHIGDIKIKLGSRGYNTEVFMDGKPITNCVKKLVISVDAESFTTIRLDMFKIDDEDD